MVRKIAIGLALQWKLNSKRENEIHSTMRIRIIYIMMIACTMLQSCDDFFDKTGDGSDVTAGKFFKDETAFMQALTGIYMQMRAPELYGNTLSLGMMEFASQTLEPYDA